MKVKGKSKTRKIELKMIPNDYLKTIFLDAYTLKGENLGEVDGLMKIFPKLKRFRYYHGRKLVVNLTLEVLESKVDE